jgi:dienelactone hydrolase
MRRLSYFVFMTMVLMILGILPAWAGFDIRGKAQDLHLYGTRGNPPVIVSSGDGGWISVAVHVAELLAKQGYFVVGFNSKTYLEGFTTKDSTLKSEDVQKDFQSLIHYAQEGSSQRPILIGASEGAGLTLLAAAYPENKSKMQGVVFLGLPDENELGWRFKDFTIWFTHKVPKEPLFKSQDYMAQVSPVPLADIQSTHDDFVSLEQAKKLFALAGSPKKLWVIEAKNHRFSNAREDLDGSLLEALEWIKNPKQ